MKRKRIFIKLFLGGVLVVCMLAVLLIFNNRFLSKNHPIDAEVLVIESWLPPDVLEQIPQKLDLSKYKTIYITGLAHHNPDYLLNDSSYLVSDLPAVLYSNGCFFLSKSALKRLHNNDTVTEIKVYAYGAMALNKYAHFFCTVGDSIIGNAFTTGQPEKYVFQTKLKLSASNNLFINFNNDLRTAHDDRNLVIDSVSVNGTTFKTPSDYCQLYDYRVNSDSILNYPFHSKSEAASAYLKALGVKNNIVIVDSFFNYRNRTLVMAEKFNFYIKKNSTQLRAFNIISVQRHSRRTYLSYKIATSGKIKIGIISLKNIGINRNTRPRAWLHYVLLEYAKIFVMSVKYIFSG
jgi:hypothetical protein